MELSHVVVLVRTTWEGRGSRKGKGEKGETRLLFRTTLSPDDVYQWQLSVRRRCCAVSVIPTSSYIPEMEPGQDF